MNVRSRIQVHSLHQVPIWGGSLTGETELYFLPNEMSER